MLSRHEIYETSGHSPGQKIILFLGFALAVVLVAIIGDFVYNFLQTYHQWLNHALFYLLSVIGVAVVVLIAAFTSYAVCMLMLRYESSRLDSLQKIQTMQAANANNNLLNATVNQLNSKDIYLAEQRTTQGNLRFKHLPKQQAKIESPKAVALPISEATLLTEPKNTLLNDIAQAQRLLIVGGQNSGKTTLLKHLARQRSLTGSVLVIDSHNSSGKWPPDYRVIGHGRDYSAIEKELRNLVAVMDCRYKELAKGKTGEREHELITVLCDEWTTVSKHIQQLDRYLLPLLTESRKVGIDFILATHSQTADSLGLKGKADLKSAFDAVLVLRNVESKRLVELDNGEIITQYRHPGAFIENINHRADFSKKLDSILNDDLIKSTAIVDKYYELKNSGQFSWNGLARAIYGNSNGVKVAELKRILDRHGIVTSQ